MLRRGRHLLYGNRTKIFQHYYLFCLFVCFSLALENKSVVLASTAIQLLDDRKSPIVAGKNVKILYETRFLTLLWTTTVFADINVIIIIILNVTDEDLLSRWLTRVCRFSVTAVGIQMKLEFFQRKFWTACRQVRSPLSLSVRVHTTHNNCVLFCLQCTALDGKCIISCDNDVSTITKLWLEVVFFLFRSPSLCVHLLTGHQLLPHWQQRIHSGLRGTFTGTGFMSAHLWAKEKELSVTFHSLKYFDKWRKKNNSAQHCPLVLSFRRGFSSERWRGQWWANYCRWAPSEGLLHRTGACESDQDVVVVVVVSDCNLRLFVSQDHTVWLPGSVQGVRWDQWQRTHFVRCKVSGAEFRFEFLVKKNLLFQKYINELSSSSIFFFFFFSRSLWWSGSSLNWSCKNSV